MPNTRLHTVDQLLDILDEIVAASGRGDRSQKSAADFWTGMLTKPGHPLSTRLPDEPLVDWHERGLLGTLQGARVLDIGCGSGRNSQWFANQGATVEAIDLAAPLLDSVQPTMPESVRLTATDFLRDPLPASQFDVVYDSGCFHHIPPHQRVDYVRLVWNALKPGGAFGLVCFAPEGGSGRSDEEVYAQGSLGWGLGYDEASLRRIWGGPFDIRIFRRMREYPAGADVVGTGSLWAMLSQRR